MSAFEQFSRQIIPTESFDSTDDFNPDTDSLYLFGSSDESRSSALLSHMQTCGIMSAFLEAGEADTLTLTYNNQSYSIGLYNGSMQDGIWGFLNAKLIYFDITGLPHHIWVPLIASIVRSNQNFQVLYVEPEEYARSQDTSRLYDLSNEYEGIRELPGFAMVQPTGENFSYIPILGFEGARFSVATGRVAPPKNKTFPIIGLPGFRPEYPFEAYVANQRAFEGNSEMTLGGNSEWVYAYVKYVDASCPFCLFYKLSDIANIYRDDIIKIALLGTKPHALGAVLFAIMNYDKTQLLYDYPKRKSGRTAGIGRIYLYYTTFFISLLADQPNDN